MDSGYINKLSLTGVSPGSAFQADLVGQVRAVQAPGLERPDFKSVLGDTVGAVNGVMAAPDKLMMDAMTTGNVDVHDVMIANAKAELAVNLTSQVATKVVQAYDRILQIQI